MLFVNYDLNLQQKYDEPLRPMFLHIMLSSALAYFGATVSYDRKIFITLIHW